MSLYSHSSSSFGHTGSESLLTHLGKKIISFGSVFLILISFCVTPDSSLVGAYG
ncbi:MAG: hypothetical protein U9Q15_02635 [Patescibacteria group bacterium]|nr:hypothetical protein [Patescibacteria group bacterium]